MCLAVYIATGCELADIPWNRESPAFHLSQVSAEDVLRKQFSLSNVYYAGSNEGCGRGFSKGVDEEYRLVQQANYDALARVLRTALAKGGHAELFTCWEDDQGEKPEIRGAVTPSELEDPACQLEELQLLRVEAG